MCIPDATMYSREYMALVQCRLGGPRTRRQADWQAGLWTT